MHHQCVNNIPQWIFIYESQCPERTSVSCLACRACYIISNSFTESVKCIIPPFISVTYKLPAKRNFVNRLTHISSLNWSTICLWSPNKVQTLRAFDDTDYRDGLSPGHGDKVSLSLSQSLPYPRNTPALLDRTATCPVRGRVCPLSIKLGNDGLIFTALDRFGRANE